MPKPYSAMLLVASALALLLASFDGAGREPPDKPLTDAERTDRIRRVQPGVSSPEQVRQLLGPPDHSARQILYHRTREQWLYDAPFAVRLEFEYVRGQEPRLLSVQPVIAGKP